MKIGLLALIFLSTLNFDVGEVKAKSLVWNAGYIPTLYYYWNCGNACGNTGWATGLGNATGNITYKAKLYDDDTNLEILDSSSIAVGSKIRIERDESTLVTDISWNGTGYTSDTPFGAWYPNATAVPEAELNKHVIYWPPAANLTYVIYVPLSVNPPVTNVVNQSANLSCADNVCTVLMAGPVTIGMDFGATYGKFYYAYDVAFSGIIYLPARQYTKVPMKSASANPYVLQVPKQTINFNLVAIDNNNSPSTPTISMISPCNANTPLNISVVANDAENDTIRYEFDWDNNGVTDQLYPNVGYVQSGVAQTISRTWVAGAHTFRVKVVDSKGGSSAWATSALFSCSAPTTPTVVTDPATAVNDTSLILNGRANPNGNLATGWFRYSTTNPGACDDSFGIKVGNMSLGNGNTNVNLNQNVSGLTSGTNYYYCALAANSNGTAFGNIVTVQTLPGVVTNLKTTPNATCGTGEIVVTWDNINGATGYYLEVDGNAPIYLAGNANTSFTHAGLADGSGHSYRVSAINSSGQGLRSGMASANAPAACSLDPDLSTTNIAPAASSQFSSSNSITFTGSVNNSMAALVGEGGWAGLEIDWNLDGVSDDYFAVPNNLTQLGSFTPGQTKNLSFTLPSNTAPAGNHQYRFNVDATNLLTESNEANNRSPWVPFTVTAIPSVDIFVSPCSITDGSDTCSTALTSWVFNDAFPTYLIKNVTLNNDIGSTQSNNNVPTILRYGTNVFNGYHQGDFSTVLGTRVVEVGCALGTIWSSMINKCATPPDISIKANPKIINNGSVSEVIIEVNAADNLSCVLYNATTDSPKHFNHDATINPSQTYKFGTKTIIGEQTVTVQCTNNVTGLNSVAEVEIEVVPTVQEI